MPRPPGLSVRIKLTLSYAGFLVVAAALLLATVWVFLLRYVPDHARIGPGPASPTRGDLLDAFAPRAAQALAVLLVLGLVGGWVLAGRMLAPLARITEATRLAAEGSLDHRIELEGRRTSSASSPTRSTPCSRGSRRTSPSSGGSPPTPRTSCARRSRPRRPSSTWRARTRTATPASSSTGSRPSTPERSASPRPSSCSAAPTRRSFTTERVDLSLLAEEATETLLPFAEEHGVALETSGVVAPTDGSPALLLQLVTNLVHNAIVHNLPERGRVWVTTGRASGAVVLTVENTGMPVSPEVVPTLPEPFRRGTERVRTDQPGVGLGLAIVRTITRAHDGTLALAPRPGGGLQVRVELPAASAVTDG